MKRTILLADDSPTIQRLVTQTFADADFKVVSVSNGDAALRKFEEIQPDIVLADIYMPGKNGYEVCGYVRRHPGLGATPVVLLVGAFDAFDETTAGKAGASGHITKPFEPQALVNLVVSLIAASGDGGQRRSISEEPIAVAESAPPLPADTQPAAVPESPASPVATTPSMSSAEVAKAAKAEDGDLLGLEDLFKPPVTAPAPTAASVTDAEIDRIAERVLQKLSTQVIENVAWDVVPDITSKILRDELKRNS